MAPKFANTEISDRRSALNELRQENIMLSPQERLRKVQIKVAISEFFFELIAICIGLRSIYLQDLLAAPVRTLTSVPESQVLSSVKHRANDFRGNYHYISVKIAS